MPMVPVGPVSIVVFGAAVSAGRQSGLASAAALLLRFVWEPPASVAV